MCARTQEWQAIALLHRQPTITGLWQLATAEQAARLYDCRRISVEASGLAGLRAGDRSR